MAKTAISRLVSILVAVLVMGTAVSVASAQDPAQLTESERETLGALFSDARSAYDQKDYPAAIAKLKAAYQIFPEPNILYRIAEMQEELGDAAAVDTYRAFLAAAPETANRQVVLDRIARIEAATVATPQTARVTLETQPAGAKVYINDTEERRGVTPLELELPPGNYVITLVKEGYDAGQRSLALKAGELRTFDFTLVETRVVQAPVPEPEPEPSMAPWVLGGTGVAAGIAAVSFLVVANGKADQIEEWDQQKDSVSRPAEYQSTLNQEATYRNLTWIAAGTSAALLISAGVVYFLTRPEDSESEPSAQWWIGPDSVGFMTRW